MKRILAIVLCLSVLVLPFKVSALSTSAKAAILINADTGEVIYSHNIEERLPMASTTKIMTALLLCEYGNFEREITVTAEMLRVEGSSMGLLAGDRVTLHDLLYGLLLASGNDAANVVAFVLGGTVNGFAKLMNERAAELGLKNTHFVTPSGLDADGHYTTAYDLAMLTRYALSNEEFAKAVASKSAVLNYGNPPYRRTLTNHNKLLKTYEGAIGVKTGFTKKAGRCLVSAAEEDGKKVIAVTLNDPDDWNDHKNMLTYGLNAIKQTVIKPEQESVDIPVISGKEEQLHIEIESFTVNTLETEGLSCAVNLPEFVYAPITKGELIGSAVFKKGDSIIHETMLYAPDDIDVAESEKGFLEYTALNIKYIFLNIWEK